MFGEKVSIKTMGILLQMHASLVLTKQGKQQQSDRSVAPIQLVERLLLWLVLFRIRQRLWTGLFGLGIMVIYKQLPNTSAK